MSIDKCGQTIGLPQLGNPKFILDLLLSIINVSVLIVSIVKGLQYVKFLVKWNFSVGQIEQSDILIEFGIIGKSWIFIIQIF